MSGGVGATRSLLTFLHLRRDLKRLEEGSVLLQWTSEGLQQRWCMVDVQAHALLGFAIVLGEQRRHSLKPAFEGVMPIALPPPPVDS